MSDRICLIVDVRGSKKQIKITKNSTSLDQLKQQIIKKFKNVTFDKDFDITTIRFDEEIEIDDDDIEDFENGSKLMIKFVSTPITPWSCVQCTFINKNSSNHCEMCNENRNTKNVTNNETKQFPFQDEYVENKDIEDDSDDEQEAQVNANDLREKAFGCSIKNENIIACIGKIRSTYIASDNSSKTTVGTGTVYKVTNQYAYVITCAHNLRFNEYFKCNQCKQKNTKRKCAQCDTTNSTAHVLKAGKIYFQRRKLDSGDIEHEYKCDGDIVYINDDKYAEFPLPKCGYDVAIIRFKDFDNYYKRICKNILLVNGRTFHRVRKKHAYYIYGYPVIVLKNPFTDKNKQREEMWGAESIHDMFEYELNEYGNQQSFLKQTEIDASKGASGSAVFSIYGKYTLIFAVHTGGSTKNKYNVGTLLDQKIDYLRIHTLYSEKIKTVQDLINDTLKKIKKDAFYSSLRQKYVYKRAQSDDFTFDISSANSQVYNIGMLRTDFGVSESTNFTKYRSTGCIIKHSSKYAYVLAASCAVIDKNKQLKAQRILFELLNNTSDGQSRCENIGAYSAVSWTPHPLDIGVAIIKINDPAQELTTIKPLKLRSAKIKVKYTKGVVIGYNCPYGRQLFGMKGDIEYSNDMKEIKYKNIIWRGAGGPIFGCEEKKFENMDEADFNEQEHVSLVERLLSKGLHIDAIINAMMGINSLNEKDIVDFISNGRKYKASKTDQEIYNKKDNKYYDIFGGQFENEIIGINTGQSAVFLNNDLLKWIKNNCK